MSTEPLVDGPVIDGPLQAIVAMFAERPPPPETLDEQRRQADETMLLIRRPIAADVRVDDHEVAVDGGTIRVRTYRPAAVEAPGPGYFFIHGGGWSQGNLDTAEVECGPVAEAVPAVVCSVEYRLAPEHPYPTPFEDCVAAYRWFLDHADELGVDPARIAIGGTSAGGNLAAGLCLAARDRGLPLPCLQWLEAPALDLTLTAGSLTELSDGYGLTAADVERYAEFYAPGDARRDPYVSPLLADDLTGLPPAVVVTAQLDPIRDDGERYVARLHQAGVAATGLRILGHFHGTWVIPVTLTWKLVEELRTTTLRHAFAGELPLAPFAGA